MLPRQARLRTSVSDWYPRITPGRWHHALWVREVALSNLRKGEPPGHEMVGARVLSETHFEFRGGPAASEPMRGAERRTLHRAR